MVCWLWKGQFGRKGKEKDGREKRSNQAVCEVACGKKITLSRKASRLTSSSEKILENEGKGKNRQLTENSGNFRI